MLVKRVEVLTNVIELRLTTAIINCLYASIQPHSFSRFRTKCVGDFTIASVRNWFRMRNWCVLLVQ